MTLLLILLDWLASWSMVHPPAHPPSSPLSPSPTAPSTPLPSASPKSAMRPITLPATAPPYFPRPSPGQAAAMARWLAHITDYGVLSVSSGRDLQQALGGVVSHSDGGAAASTCHIFFYLTPLDELPRQLPHTNGKAAFTVTEGQLPGGCRGMDPEDPTCAKATYLGTMHLLSRDGPDQDTARDAMFSRHPQMRSWPAEHNFQLYELQVHEVHLLDFYGGMKTVSGEEYCAFAPAA